MDFVDNYLGEIIVGVGISFVLGIFGAIRAFFVGVRRMELKLEELEDKIEANFEADSKLAKWVEKLVDHKMKGQ